MKIITLTQPWATLVALAEKSGTLLIKTFETRSWQTHHRGPLGIHAAKGFPKWAQELCETEPFHEALMQYPDFVTLGYRGLPTGCLLATCDLVSIVSASLIHRQDDVPQRPAYRLDPSFPDWYVPDTELAFGDYSPRRFAWKLDNVRALPEPIPAKGALGLWAWNGCEVAA